MATGTIIMIIVAALEILTAGGCASAHKVRDLSDDMRIAESKGSAGMATVGLNEKREIVVQEETQASTELSIQKNVNLHWLTELEHEGYMLKWCRRDMADPRLGGNGSLPADPEVDNLKDPEQIREEIGLDDSGHLKVVKQTYFLDQLKRERAYGSALQKMLKVIKRHREECDFAMGQARTKAGLPSTRYSGERLENGLDAAFSKGGAVETFQDKIRKVEQTIVSRDRG
jgi:hypothetical protein